MLTHASPASETEDLFDSSLFDNENYDLKPFSFGSHIVRLLCSDSATTDHDLTGQILWPAASLLATYVAAHPSILSRCGCALELGAGLGLVGLLAAQSCPVVLTDHNDVVLRVLSRNVQLNQAQYDIRCLKLEWNSQSDISAALAASPDKQGYDTILGADVCYSLNALPALFGVAARLLHSGPGCRFLLGHVSRAYSIDRQLIVEAQAAGFAIREETGTRQQVGGSLEGVVYSLTLAKT